MGIGTLYIVGTPIGNLKDITLRAIETLNSVSLIAAEDTRRTRNLTTHYNIKTQLISYFEYNKLTRGEYLIRLLKEGKDIALVSDSGMPGISDPGFHIINLALVNNINVTVIPGPTAFTAGLVLSGMPAHRFAFEGFLPPKTQSRKNKLKELSGENRTLIFYESPHRLTKTLEDIKEVLGDRIIAVVREVTKKFEEVKRGSVSDILEYFTEHKPRGEFVIIVSK